jgi:hypothetical protein
MSIPSPSIPIATPNSCAKLFHETKKNNTCPHLPLEYKTHLCNKNSIRKKGKKRRKI